MAEPVVRPARRSDAGAIGEIHVRSWQAAYAGKMPADYLDGLNVDDRIKRWMDTLDGGVRPPDGVLVVEHPSDERVVGFSYLGASREEEGIGQIWAIYLHPAAWGIGLGRVLFEGSVDYLRSAGFTEGILWVLDTNDRARRFYELAGWQADGGTQVDDHFGFPINEVRYRGSLAG